MNRDKNPIQREKNTIRKMIGLYCKNKHLKQGLCEDCQGLLSYAWQRLDNCKYGAQKPTCEQCPVHCYKPDMRNKIKSVMRFSGPRMIFFHPLDAILHMLKNKTR